MRADRQVVRLHQLEGLRLTEVGERYLTDCRRILAELEDADRQAAGLHAAPRGRVSLTASALFGQVLQHEPDNTRAIAGTIRCAMVSGDQAGAKQMFDALTDELRKLPEFASISAALELAEAGESAGAIPDLMEKVAHDHDNHQARFDLAMALYTANKPEAAADELLEIIRRDRNWNDEGARKQLVKFFEAWGPTDPMTLQGRRRLSSLLFS